MFHTFVRPTYEYCLLLFPLPAQAKLQLLQLEKQMFTALTNIRKARLPWFRKLFRISDIEERRQILRDKMKETSSDNPRVPLE